MPLYYNPGTYLGEITNHILGETKTGKPQLILQFMVQAMVNEADPANPLSCGDQYERTMYRVITDKTIDFVMEDLQRLGFQGNSFSELDLNTDVHQDFRGQKHEFYCQHREYNGKTHEDWGFARGAAVAKPLDTNSVRQLDAMFGKQLKAQSQAAKAAAPQQAAPVAVPVAAQSVPQANVRMQPPSAATPQAASATPQSDDIPF
jgi:hypothetical protein